MSSTDVFARNLHQLRKRRRLTQNQLAQQLFVSTQAVSKWERGESVPDLCHIYSLTEILNVTADALLGISPETETALLAVDGGGTKTEFVLITPQGKLLKRFVLPGANPNGSSRESCLQILQQGIDQMLQTGCRLLGVSIGCAGMASGDHGAVITSLLRKQYPGIRLQCQSDICNILACAQDPDNAIAAICGTGSVVYATAQGKMIRAGGGGWMLDPQGSGYDLGRQALLAALEHRDGIGEPTLLTQAVEQRLGGSVWESIPALYALPPAGIAAYAPVVLDAWQKGDAIASRIVDTNCRRLAELITHAASVSVLAKEVLLGGSILLKTPSFRQHLTQMLPDTLTVSSFRYPPVWGACLQCAQLCDLPRPDIQLFLPEYETEVAKC